MKVICPETRVVYWEDIGETYYFIDPVTHEVRSLEECEDDYWCARDEGYRGTFEQWMERLIEVEFNKKGEWVAI